LNQLTLVVWKTGESGFNTRSGQESFSSAWSLNSTQASQVSLGDGGCVPGGEGG